MIQSVTIENFKSFERATLPLAPLTLLIGANASGKSNAVEAMQLLSWLAKGNAPGDLLYAVREQELSLRGGLSDLAGGDREIVLGCLLEGPAGTLSFGISLGVTEDGLEVFGESFSRADGGAGGHDQGAERLSKVPLPKLAKGRREPRAVLEDLTSILFLDPAPGRMREYSFPQEKRLKPDGSALSAVLHRLTEEEGRRGEILEIIRSFPEQDITGISYLETPRGELMVRLHETFGGREVPREAALLSDGTLRVLAVAAALLSVPEGSVVVIEEIDNGVHPSRAEHLLSSVQRISRERNLRVLLTSHNPALLDALPVEAIPDTVACYRDPEKGDSRLIRLQDLESYPELIAQGPVGRLVTKGILDRYLKAPEKRDRAKKAERDLAWVESFRRQA